MKKTNSILCAFVLAGSLFGCSTTQQKKLTTRSMLTRSSEQQTTDIPFPVPAVLSA